MRSTPTDARAAVWLPLPPRDYLILLALADGPRHGHGLLKAVEAEAGGVLFDPANLYRLLRKLERDALVSEVRPAATREHDRRRQYTLTALGRAVLRSESARLVALADGARARKLVTGRPDPR
jgi:DNA-binding PadR family transcriptional regulator